MLWVYGLPQDPYVGTHLDIECENALKLLEELNQDRQQRLTFHHLLLKIIADTLGDHPNLNVRIMGRDMFQLPSVNIATPINLIGTKWESQKSELGVALLNNAEQKTLEAIAAELSGVRTSYKKKGSSRLLEATGKRLAHLLPSSAFDLFLSGAGAFGHNRHLYRLAQDTLGVSTILTNVGSIYTPKKGAHWNTGFFTLPTRMIQLSTFFAATHIAEKVVADNGRAVVRKVLPLIVLFDHRVVDGYRMSRFAEDLCTRLYEPQHHYPVPQTAPT